MTTSSTANLSLLKANTGTSEPWNNDNFLNNNWDKVDKRIGNAAVKTTTTTVGNTTTETRVHSGLVPAIGLIGATFTVRVWGTYDNSAVATNFVVRVKIGGTQLTAVTYTTPASLQTNNGWWADAEIVATALGGAGVGAWRTCLRAIKSDSASGTSSLLAVPGAVTLVDNTVAQTFEITVQWTAAAAGNVVRADAGIYRTDFNA